MGAVPGWLRIGGPVVVLLVIAALLVWIIGAFLGFILKLLIGAAFVIGIAALVANANARDREISR